MNGDDKASNIDYRKINLLIIAVCMFLYGINRLTKFHESDESLLKYIWDYNFTDYLCQFVFFAAYNVLSESMSRRGVYSYKTIIAISAICCLYWEIGVLYTRTGTVFDPADWIAYLFGATTYYCIFKAVRGRNNTTINGNGEMEDKEFQDAVNDYIDENGY